MPMIITLVLVLKSTTSARAVGGVFTTPPYQSHNVTYPFSRTSNVLPFNAGSRPWGLVNTQPSQRVNERSPLSNMSNIMNGTSSGIRRNNMLFSDCNKQNMSQQSDLTREHVNANDYNIGASSRPIGGVFTTPVYKSQNAIDPFSRVSNDNPFNAGICIKIHVAFYIPAKTVLIVYFCKLGSTP
ncbi:uncharacterized protein LOC135152574 [Daucus carota subsp. sativus]|uniref:uncharacterized protein LOC135152574 n=1 Tax=Daucus carota subsp. sativus TaxID=79200 RepID=UPI003082F68E